MSVKTSLATQGGDVELGKKGEKDRTAPRTVHYDDKTATKLSNMNMAQKSTDESVKLGTVMGVFVPTLQNILGA